MAARGERAFIQRTNKQKQTSAAVMNDVGPESLMYSGVTFIYVHDVSVFQCRLSASGVHITGQRQTQGVN